MRPKILRGSVECQAKVAAMLVLREDSRLVAPLYYTYIYTGDARGVLL